MKITDYFESFSLDIKEHDDDKLHTFVDFYQKDTELDLSVYDLVVIGVQEGRLSLKNESCAFAPDEIRSELYDLYKGDWSLKVVDLGNLKIGNRIEDTYFILQKIIEYFLKENKMLLVFGGGHDLVTPIFNGQSSLGMPLSFASADAYLDFQDGGNYHSRSFLSNLVSSSNSLLSKYTLFAYQSYLCSLVEVDLLKSMDFNLIRLGEFNADITEMEPYLRDLDHLSIDLAVVKSSDAPGTIHSSPNGVTAETLCRLMRYAGMSNGLKSVLLSELNPRLDKNNQSAKVFAQSIWYFIEGLNLRNDDFPDLNSNNFKKFHVSAGFSDLIFYKSNSSVRWWVEHLNESDSGQIALLPCSVTDYNKAVQGELSSRLSSQLKF